MSYSCNSIIIGSQSKVLLSVFVAFVLSLCAPKEQIPQLGGFIGGLMSRLFLLAYYITNQPRKKRNDLVNCK